MKTPNPHNEYGTGVAYLAANVAGQPMDADIEKRCDQVRATAYVIDVVNVNKGTKTGTKIKTDGTIGRLPPQSSTAFTKTQRDSWASMFGS
jgi:hypothetical protein